MNNLIDVLLQSGSPFDPWVNSFPPEYHRQEVKALAKLVDCSPEDIENDGNLLRCLQKAPAKDMNMNLVLVSLIHSNHLCSSFFVCGMATVKACK